MTIPEEQQQRMFNTLTAKLDMRPCPMCGYVGRPGEQVRTISNEGYAVFTIQESLQSVQLGGGTIIPAAIVGCNNCGFIAFHALIPLGLLPSE
jgi:hypothetical protein